MEGLLRTWLALALALAMVTAQTISPANFTNGDIGQQTDPVGISVSMGENMVPLADIIPLTSTAGKEIPVCDRQKQRDMPRLVLTYRIANRSKRDLPARERLEPGEPPID